MGVPKFYRWLSERYPCLSEVVTDEQIPEFDNLYLDMNGIIHGCSHPNDEDVSFRISEEQIFRDIFTYIDTLFGIIKPKKVFFMAVDGVAPRAKMNQQRARRFMSAKNAELALKAAEASGAEIPEEKRFDSNCITPGTEFMARLHEQLQYFIQMKISTDTSWQGLRIYLSGHDCPGEGEHKIMDFIRSERSEPGYDANTRHCMYGLDADLIMLGMCSHEPHFSLLREEVKFGCPRKGSKPSKKTGVEGITFHLLHLSLLREYLSWEFHAVKEKLPFAFDLESIIDDWVMMGFLVGNDFIPHLPHVHIHEDALPLLYKIYMQVLPQLDGYINESGILNMKRFEKFLKVFAKNDRRCFVERCEDEAYLASKRREGRGAAAPASSGSPADEDEEFLPFEDSDMEGCSGSEGTEAEAEAVPRPKGAFDSDSEDELEEEVESSGSPEGNGFTLPSAADVLADGLPRESLESENADVPVMDDEDFSIDPDLLWTKSVNRAFKHHKRDYYNEKMKYENISKEELREQAEGYVRAIQWNLHYYYHGCCSWNWFYKHHYAPYISDVVDFSEMEMNFEKSRPFRPFEQLLAVLPAASASCLPVPFQELMTEETSPIIDFYPKEFETDLNGKKNDWEAVVLIPFIQEERLLNAIASKESRLTEEERRRNSHGPHLLFTTDAAHPRPLVSSFPGAFLDIKNCIAKKEEVDMDKFRIEPSRVVHGLLPGVKLDVYFPGFPTTKHIPHTAELQFANIRVFQQPSRKQSMILKISERPELEKDIAEVAGSLIGKEVHVYWPILKRGLVHEIWTADKKFLMNDEGKIISEEFSGRDGSAYRDYCREVRSREFERLGIDTGKDIGIALVRPMLGVHCNATKNGTELIRQWSKAEDAKPHSVALVVQNVLEDTGRDGLELTVEEAYPENSIGFIVSATSRFYGYMAKVTENLIRKKCTVNVLCSVPAVEFDTSGIIQKLDSFALSWFDISVVTKQTLVTRSVLFRITSSLYLCPDERPESSEDKNKESQRINIGLELRFAQRNEAIPDYARRTSDGRWEYSFNAVRLLREYRNKFPEVFEELEKLCSGEQKYFYADEIWPSLEQSKRLERIKELTTFLGSLPTASLKKEKADGLFVDGNIIHLLETEAAKMNRIGQQNATFKRLSVKAHALFRPELHKGNTIPDPDAEFRLLDRVVCVRKGRGAPFAGRGTVVGILGKGPEQKVEVLFDVPFFGGIKIRGERASGSRLPIGALINMTHGKRVRKEVDDTFNLNFIAKRSDSTNAAENLRSLANSSTNVPKRQSYRNTNLPMKGAEKHFYFSAPVDKSNRSQLFPSQGQSSKPVRILQRDRLPSEEESGYGKPPSVLSNASALSILTRRNDPSQNEVAESKESKKSVNEGKQQVSVVGAASGNLDEATSVKQIENVFSKLGLGKEKANVAVGQLMNKSGSSVAGPSVPPGGDVLRDLFKTYSREDSSPSVPKGNAGLENVKGPTTAQNHVLMTAVPHRIEVPPSLKTAPTNTRNHSSRQRNQNPFTHVVNAPNVAKPLGGVRFQRQQSFPLVSGPAQRLPSGNPAAWWPQPPPRFPVQPLACAPPNVVPPNGMSVPITPHLLFGTSSSTLIRPPGNMTPTQVIRKTAKKKGGKKAGNGPKETPAGKSRCSEDETKESKTETNLADHPVAESSTTTAADKVEKEGSKVKEMRERAKRKSRIAASFK